jgi:hypothetical protein
MSLVRENPNFLSSAANRIVEKCLANNPNSANGRKEAIMSAAALKPLPMVAQLAHWTGCVLATCAVLVFVVFAVGLGVPPLPDLNTSFAAIGVMLLGFVLMWWKDWLGGVVSLVGLGWFQAMEIAANGHAAGGLFLLLVIPGVLGIIAALVRGYTRLDAISEGQ